MAARRPEPSELRGAQPLFVLTVTWAGRIFRFAERPCTIDLDGREMRFAGTLDLRGFTDTLGRPGTTQQGGSASLGVDFQTVNVCQEYIEGRILEGASCELSMVFWRAGAVITPWEDRIVQLSGAATKPQLGFVERPSSFAAFTVTARPFDDKTPILRPEAKITAVTHPAANLSAEDGLQGAVYPLVFGSPGDQDVPGSPAYLINTTAGQRKLLIGVGRQEAARVTVSDAEGDQYTLRDVEHASDTLGTLYAYVSIVSAPAGFNNAGGKHYTHWINASIDEYGLRNPFGPGGLRKGGDLLRYLYELTAYPVDHPAFIAAAPVLDRYTFGGHVNDPAVTVWNFCRSKLLPYMPCQLRVGTDGLYPVSLLPMQPLTHLPQVTLGAATGIEQVSPVQVTRKLSDVVNQIALSYFHNAREDRLTQQVIASTDTALTTRARFTEAQRSAELYGARAGAEEEVSYIDNESSAQHVLRWLLYDRGFLHMAVQVTAAPRWGWLMVGDQVSLTADDLGMSGHRAVVFSKTWNKADGRWRIVLTWSLAPIETSF